MRILIYGTGGVGGYLAANVCALDDEITCVARGAHLDAIRAHGIRVREDERDYAARPDVACEAGELSGCYDLVLLCVKAYDLDAALDALAGHTSAQTVVLPLLNGVAHFEPIARRLEGRMLRGCCYILSHVEAPGVIRREGKVFAAVFGSAEDPEAVRLCAGRFEAAGLRHKTPDAFEAAIWKKYLFISAFATLTSYYDMSIRRALDAHPDEAEALCLEIAAVARAQGIEIGDEVAGAIRSAQTLPPESSTSMHLDFQHKRPSELESLSGYIVNAGQSLGIATPVMKRMYEALKHGND